MVLINKYVLQILTLGENCRDQSFHLVSLPFIGSKFQLKWYLLSITVVVAIASSWFESVKAQSLFTPPRNSVPRNTTREGVQRNTQLQPPKATPANRTTRDVWGNVQSHPSRNTAPNRTTEVGVRRNIDFQPPEEPAPNDTASGGARGSQVATIIPLLPSTQYGRTVAARPTFFVYVPPGSVKQKVFFSLQDENRKPYYQTILELSGKGGIVSVTLPDNAPELEMGKNYLWFFALIPANGLLRPDSDGVIGWVKRVESPIQNSQSLKTLELASLYAQSGIWYDTLNLVAAAMLAEPDDATLASNWQNLLGQVGLEAIANQPITDRL